MPDPPPQPEPPASLLDRVAALEARISALEANLSRVEEEQPVPVELDRVRWFMKHGRQRPW